MALNLKMSSQRNVLALGSTLGGKRLVAAPLTRKYYRKLGLGTRSFRGDSADEEELLPFVCSAERRKRLSQSLFSKTTDLPAHGKTLSQKDETCDAFNSVCRTPIHIWEAKCTSCSGSGTVNTTSSRGRRGLATCLKCAGVGWVRHVSTFLDDVEELPEFTIGRTKNSGPAPYCHVPQIPRKQSEEESK